ncbi:MAG: lipoprotein [Arenicella sp.]
MLTTFRTLIASGIVLIILSACGNKGPLIVEGKEEKNRLSDTITVQDKKADKAARDANKKKY